MGFKDAFTRNENKDSNLEYDDTAFYYFFVCILFTILIFLVYFMLKPIFSSKKSQFNRNCQCQPCKKKVQKIKQQQSFKWFTFGYIFKIAILVCILYLIKYSFEQLSNTNTILKSFNPYEILEVEESATEPEIRKAFRKQTLKYHPDKNKDDPQAAAKFIMITKAYDCLTDEKTKEICQKFGNPDGPGSFNIAIALPSFLLKKENHVTVLFIFFIVLLIIIPAVILSWWQSISKKDRMKEQNQKHYFQFLNENLQLKQCSEILALSSEISLLMPAKSNQEGVILEKLYKENLPNIVPPRIPKPFLKALILINTQIYNQEVDPLLQKDLNEILRLAPQLLENIIEFAGKFPKEIDGRKTPKYFGLNCTLNLIKFQQMLIQGLQQTDLDILQMNYFKTNEDLFEKIDKKFKKSVFPSLYDIVHKPTEQQKLLKFVPEEDQAKIIEELALFPKIKVECKAYVADEDEICVGDIVTIEVQITRENLKEKQESTYVHSLKYPFLKQENWYVIIAEEDKNEINFIKLIKDQKKVIEEKFQFFARFPKQHKLMVYVKSDSYKGLEIEVPIEFLIKKQPDHKREIFVHPDDQALDREPSMMQQLLQGMQNKQDSDDEIEEEEEEEGQKINKKKLKELERKKKNKESNQNHGDEDEELEEQEQEEELQQDKNQTKQKQNNDSSEQNEPEINSISKKKNQ